MTTNSEIEQLTRHIEQLTRCIEQLTCRTETLEATIKNSKSMEEFQPLKLAAVALKQSEVTLGDRGCPSGGLGIWNCDSISRSDCGTSSGLGCSIGSSELSDCMTVDAALVVLFMIFL